LFQKYSAKGVVVVVARDFEIIATLKWTVTGHVSVMLKIGEVSTAMGKAVTKLF
jgi:hypothetical protein